jgi:hypothetical protein
MAHDDERLDPEAPASSRPTPMRSGADLERATRIRQGKRVNFTPEERAERQRMLEIYRDSFATKEQHEAAGKRLLELDYGVPPVPIPAWVARFAAKRHGPGPVTGAESIEA